MHFEPHPLAHAARLACVAGLGGTLLVGCGDGEPLPVNTLPANVTELAQTAYPATAPGAGNTAATQDLLTAGLGRDGLQAAAPVYADPLVPTALELRRNAIHSNYRGLVDIATAGGYGSLYGPNVDVAGNATASQGLIPGREYVAVLDDSAGRKRVAIAVQIPDSFNTAAPCLVLGPSSGSRGVYGAIATSAEWGLKHGCAVALTDAGKGVGLYDLSDDTVNRIDGTRATRSAAGALAHFAADVADTARAAYNLLFPNRVALKQAHSQLNPEKDWGNDTLAAASYALYSLNSRYGTVLSPVPFTAANTLVIAGSVSNGGAAVLRAAEQDTAGLIDGVVAGEPVTELPTASGYGVRFNGAAVGTYGKPLADFTTYGNVYQPCAALAVGAAMTEATTYNYMQIAGLNGRAANRCASLAAKGLVTGADTAAQSLDALNRLRNYGWTTDNDTMHTAHWGLGNGPILSAMYPTSYGRFSVTDNVCATSFAQADGTGAPVVLTATTKAQSFAVANGTANGTPATVIYNDSLGGASSWPLAKSASNGVQDFGLDNALCQRALVTGVDETGAALTAVTTSFRPTAAQSMAVRAGIAEVTLNGNLRAKPTLIVAGRSDALIPVNNNARAYVAFNKLTEGTASKVGYIEVTSAQHFDGFLSFTGFNSRFVPLHVYFNRAMDAMYANLRNGTALPASQVVRTTPRGGDPTLAVGTPGAVPAITATNVPAISATPSAGNQIGFVGTSIDVPN